MIEPTWISVLPPLLAIGLAIVTRQVYLSLAAGIWLGWTILVGWNPIAGTGRAIDETVRVLEDMLSGAPSELAHAHHAHDHAHELVRAVLVAAVARSRTKLRSRSSSRRATARGSDARSAVTRLSSGSFVTSSSPLAAAILMSTSRR